MNFSFHPEAAQEFEEAVAYYESRATNLGIDFYKEVLKAIQRTTSYPLMWRKIEGEIRCCLVHRFPYGILYSLESEEIFILAIMHLYREPNYWKHRLI